MIPFRHHSRRSLAESAVRSLPNSQGRNLTKSRHSISAAAFGKDPGRVLSRIRSSKIILTEQGRARAAVTSAKAFERTETKQTILEALERGEQEIASGRGCSLDKVLADADKILARVR